MNLFTKLAFMFAHNRMLGTGVITKHACNNKCAVYNIRVTPACKLPSHTQSAVSYCPRKFKGGLHLTFGHFYSVI